jgi:hypothetical protein
MPLAIRDAGGIVAVWQRTHMPMGGRHLAANPQPPKLHRWMSGGETSYRRRGPQSGALSQAKDVVTFRMWLPSSLIT